MASSFQAASMVSSSLLSATGYIASVPSHPKPAGHARHAFASTYLSAAHLVAVVPSHVWPAGQSVHSLPFRYFSAAHASTKRPVSYTHLTLPTKRIV